MTNFVVEKDNDPVVDLLLQHADFVDGVWVSDLITVGNYEAAMVDVEYEDATPNRTPESGNVQVNYALQAQLQAESAIAGRFYPLVTQLEGYNATETAARRILIADPKVLNVNPESELVDSEGQHGEEATRTTARTAHLPDKVRMVILLNEDGSDATFESVKVTMVGQLY